MTKTGPIKRRGFMKLGMKCGIALLAARNVRGGIRERGSGSQEYAGIRRILRTYGSEFGATAALEED